MGGDRVIDGSWLLFETITKISILGGNLDIEMNPWILVSYLLSDLFQPIWRVVRDGLCQSHG